MYFPPADYSSFIQNFLIICKKGKKKETQNFFCGKMLGKNKNRDLRKKL